MMQRTPVVAAAQRPCWLCGCEGRPAREDPHSRADALCRSCWKRSPRCANAWTRSGEAVIAALGLPRHWQTSGARFSLAQQVAGEYGIKARRDVSRMLADTGDGHPFGWLSQECISRARLRALELEHQTYGRHPLARRVRVS